MKTRYLGLLLPLLLTSLTSVAQEEKWTHYGLRPLGMGNAFVAVVDDFNALFYNPAGLARLKEWDGEFINPRFVWSAKTQKIFPEIQDLVGGGGNNTEEVLDLLEQEAGSVHHIEAGLTPHLIFPGFGFGLGINLENTLIFHRYPSVEIDAGPRITLPIALAFNALEDRLSVGLTLKGLVRGGIDQEFSIQDIDALTGKNSDEVPEEERKKLTDFLEGGFGIGADAGLLFTPIKTMQPTIGISVANIGGVPYTKMNVSGAAIGAPAVEEPSVNTGFSIMPIQSGWLTLLTAVDFHSINREYSFSKKVNFGLELGLSSLLKIQTGFHQGYMSGGFQFDVGLLNLRFITYAEEMGPTAGTLEDRRYAVQIKLII